MGYDIYDLETANLIVSFPTKGEALALVRQAVREAGEKAVATWALGRSDHTDTAVYGRSLIEQAIGSAPA